MKFTYYMDVFPFHTKGPAHPYLSDEPHEKSPNCKRFRVVVDVGEPFDADVDGVIEVKAEAK